MTTKIDRFEIKQKTGNEYGIWDHKEDVYIIILNDKNYTNIKTTLTQLKTLIDDAVENGNLNI